MVKAVKNANMLGLNIKPMLTINITIPKIVFSKPLVVLYSTSLTPFVNKKIASNKTDNPRISDAAITPSIGNAMVIIPKIIAIMLIVVCLFKIFPPYFQLMFFLNFHINYIIILFRYFINISFSICYDYIFIFNTMVNV